MTIYSYGYMPNESDPDKRARELLTFRDNIDLLLEHKEDILSCSEYFFCPLSFAHCSWPYISGDGPLHLGHLLMGWTVGVFKGECPDCSGAVLVNSFGGSPLSGSNRWTGICLACKSEQKGRWQSFRNHWTYAAQILQSFPFKVAAIEEYDGHVFTWGGNGLAAARKRRRVWRPVTTPVSLDVLVSELKNGQPRIGEPPRRSTQTQDGQIQLKFSNKAGYTFHVPATNSIPRGEPDDSTEC